MSSFIDKIDRNHAQTAADTRIASSNWGVWQPAQCSVRLLSLLFLIAGSAFAGVTDFQSLQSIKQTASDFLEQQQALLGNTEHVSIEIGQLDARLRLSNCNESLNAFLPPGSKVVGRVSVGVSCSGPKPWTLYVPAQVKNYTKVLIAKRTMGRGTLIDANNVKVQLLDIGSLAYGHLSTSAEAIGKRLKRPIRAGSVILPNQLEAIRQVKRGERVQILASTGGVQIQVKGKALANGALGETISVRNLSSKRVIDATVIGPGKVEVQL